MHPILNTLLNLFARWAHVLAGIIWVGHLYWFNFVNAPAQARVDPAAKRALALELMPRALYWFRWGAVWTWFTGIVLAGLVYYHGKQVFDGDYQKSSNPWLWLFIVLVVMAAGFVAYNFITKTLPNKSVAAAINLLLLAAVYFFFESIGHFGGRALYIHTGAILGTMMALNVWMVIWPAQQKMLAAVKEGAPLAADAPLVRNAALRARHNTFMSVPLVFTMISNHYGQMYGQSFRDVCLIGVFVVGYVATRLVYAKASTVEGL